MATEEDLNDVHLMFLQSAVYLLTSNPFSKNVSQILRNYSYKCTARQCHYCQEANPFKLTIRVLSRVSYQKLKLHQKCPKGNSVLSIFCKTCKKSCYTLIDFPIISTKEIVSNTTKSENRSSLSARKKKKSSLSYLQQQLKSKNECPSSPNVSLSDFLLS